MIGAIGGHIKSIFWNVWLLVTFPGGLTLLAFFNWFGPVLGVVLVAALGLCSGFYLGAML